MTVTEDKTENGTDQRNVPGPRTRRDAAGLDGGGWVPWVDRACRSGWPAAARGIRWPSAGWRTGRTQPPSSISPIRRAAPPLAPRRI